MTENRTMNVQRFPDCSCSEDCLHDQGTARNYEGCYGLCIVKKYRSVSVAMSGKIRGAINACIEFLVTFWGNAKK